MLGLAGRRMALVRPACQAPAALLAGVTSVPSTKARGFTSTPQNDAFRPTWMPMRVKTPWIDALTRSQEAANGSQVNAQLMPKEPDLTPKKMSDSYYSAVSFKFHSVIEIESLIARGIGSAFGAG